MAVYEKITLLMCKDAAGNKVLLYPITTLDNVDGAEDLLHYGAAQVLTDAEQAQARANIGAAEHKALVELNIRATTTEGEIESLRDNMEGLEAAVRTVKKAAVYGETLIL